MGFLRKKVNTKVFKIPRYLPRGIYLFTNRVITHFGSNFLKLSCDFGDLGVGKTKNLQVNTLQVNTR